ncbi:MAG: TetR/AcrR family transcriptional regulator [Roseibium sp.]|uniref:TetR/AcrR family transcriptional regulator n=1 Tax=Roseibium sp. TaxID=1936156 RepID=UPI001B09FED0|nr:TetR/AcrR family transcriptional regulator [Roseibium sp.]MBO6893462.1 TetR/AcrR family transcriptional regulator [Roseibium sp.]MBO6930674.1 TetR/AcrR family transcriptional regulator [Roseibium sp.]
MALEVKQAGRPRQQRVTEALLTAALEELSDNGYEKATIAAIAGRARTSKQAIYRRYENKTDLLAAALAQGFRSINLSAPQRSSVAEDLRRCLVAIVASLQETPLGGAVRALLPYRDLPPVADLFADVENEQRLVFRQIFIATAFESDMETRIDLLLGLIYFRFLIRLEDVTATEIERAIYLVLGLVPPRNPVQGPAFPGM